MAERPILFNDAMVKAILDGRKTQTRRPLAPQPSAYVPGPNVHEPKHPAAYLDSYCSERKTPSNPRGMSDRWCWWTPDNRQGPDWIRCPFGVPGDRLWVREAHALLDLSPDGTIVAYRASCPNDCFDFVDDEGAISGIKVLRWRPSIHMPRWASRITLRVTGVRVERLRDISEDDARAEGMEKVNGHEIRGAFLGIGPCYREGFAQAWADIYGAESWDFNPWTWVVSFEREATNA